MRYAECAKIEKESAKCVLYYVHDPMCSWCWAFNPAWRIVLKHIPPNVSVSRVVGGLAPDTNDPMPEQLRKQLQNTWRRIQNHVPGTDFNFDFWSHCKPRRSTYPACRAVIAAREQDSNADERMTFAIQRAYYQQARNPSDSTTLIELATEIGLQKHLFIQRLESPQTEQVLNNEIHLARSIGATSFPSLVLGVGEGLWPIPVDYTNPQCVVDTICALLEVSV